MTTSNPTNEAGTQCSELSIENEGEVMIFHKKTVEKLRQKYNQARADGADSLQFDSHELMTAYCKYLIEYLDQRFEEPTDG